MMRLRTAMCLLLFIPASAARGQTTPTAAARQPAGRAQADTVSTREMDRIN